MKEYMSQNKKEIYGRPHLLRARNNINNFDTKYKNLNGDIHFKNVLEKFEIKNKESIPVENSFNFENGNLINFPSLDISEIQKNDNSNFLDNIYGHIDELKMERDSIEKRIFHIFTDNFDDYFHNLKHLIKTPYNYYFIYRDEGWNFYIQIQYQSPKELFFSQIRNCQLMPPVRDYSFFRNLLENHFLLDFNIDLSITFLNLSKGPAGGKEYMETNRKLIQYCEENDIKQYKKP